MRWVLVLLPILLLGCTVESTDAVIVFEQSGAFTAEDRVTQIVSLTSDSMTLTFYDAQGTQTLKRSEQVSPEDFLRVSSQLDDFFTLEDTYNPVVQVTDVGVMRMTVIWQGRTKTVFIDPFVVSELPSKAQSFIKAFQQTTKSLFEKAPVKRIISYQPMQCAQTPWQKWYQQGTIQFVTEPTDEQLISAYYATEYDVPLQQVIRLESEVAVCEACYTCPTPFLYEAQVSNQFILQMLTLGWS